MPKFFAVTAPGFESEMESEIKNFHAIYEYDHGFQILSSQKGGVEFQSDVKESVYLNLYSKLATRILVRWDEFHCVFFSDLEKKLRGRSLSEWFPPKSRVFVKVNSRKSKLGQEKKIFEVFNRVYSGYELLSKASESEESDFILLVDFFEDVCTLSIDTTGPALYKRMLDKKVSFGSMRETIAQWALRKIHTLDSPWKEPTVLIDPFAGSGTLLLESQNVGINTHRSYTFSKLVFFKELKPLDKSFISFSKLPFIKLVGIESEHETFDILQQNLRKISNGVKVELFHGKNGDYENSHSERIWIFSNLPYGKQVKSETLKDMMKTLKLVFKPQLLALFHPEPVKDKEALHALHFPVINGGLKITLSILIYIR
ncbi:MAG: hypothetical protein JNL11_18560 [Bdellovibrionaceae bacterium]|nr:hypothetical protein [Pseudobdellovibrionaceae bacterium]